VVVVTRNTPEDIEFSSAALKRLEDNGARVLATVRGAAPAKAAISNRNRFFSASP
jgi:hypothetical protein